MRAPPIDFALLNRRTLGDAVLQTDLLRLFRTHSSTVLANLKTGIEQKDPAATAAAAHRLRGSASTIAATALSERVTELEAAVRQGDHAEAAVCLTAVNAEFVRCIQAIDDAVPANASPD